ncbi:cysteine-rich CWC family protein [Herminiimonas sp. NPDC097707]|uniref:cysteine-rich CWC family protein n=1 Tax=Herminiimonas sp. NPDC097707 TaxID=3364007 RepID=UPI00383AD28A
MSHCSQCGAEFSCGMVDTSTTVRCWCTALPRANEILRNVDGNAKTCMCAHCLSALRARRLAE